MLAAPDIWNDDKITSMDLENKNLKVKLKQYSIFLKNAVTENDKLKAKSTSSIDLTKLTNENIELVKQLKSSVESIREKNEEIAKIKTHKIDLGKALSNLQEKFSVAQNNVRKLEIDKFLMKQNEG